MLKGKCKKVIFSAREADESFSKGSVGKILSQMHMLTCNSRATYEMLQSVNENIECINNGVESKNNKLFEDIISIKNIGVIANITRRKNVQLVIESISNISKGISVNIAGKIEDNDYYEEIKEYIHKRNLEDRVNFMGYVSDMDSFYEQNDIVILPSLYEGTSNVILESFSRKKIILLSNIPENSCLIKNEYKDIMMFDPHSSKDLGDKINNIVKLNKENKVIIEKIVKENNDFVVKEYSIENLKAKYLDIINRI